MREEKNLLPSFRDRLPAGLCDVRHETGVDEGETEVSNLFRRMIDNPADQFKKQLDDALSHGGGPRAARFALACLGAIPGIGGAIAGIAGTWSDQEQAEFNRIFADWMKLQEDEI